MYLTLIVDHHFKMVADLNQQGLFPTYVFFSCIKDDTDQNYISKERLYSFGYSRSSVDRFVRKMVSIGWADWDKDKTRLYLIAFKKVFSMYGAKLEERIVEKKTTGKQVYLSNKTRVFANSIRELKAVCLFLYLLRRIKLFVKNEFSKHSWERLRKRKRDAILKARVERFFCKSNPDFVFGFSVRQAAQFLGYKTAMSGSRILKLLSDLGFIERRNRLQYIGYIEDVKHEHGVDYINQYCVVKNGAVFKRNYSEIRFLVF